MNDLTEGFRLFRELARVVWNCGLRLYPDGQHEFGSVQDALFTAMVATQATHTPVKMNADGIKYYPGIKVATTQEHRRTAFVGYLEGDYVDWKPEELTASSDLRFGTAYDFNTLDGLYRDLRYIFCADVSDPQNIRRVLIDAHDVTLEEVTADHPSGAKLDVDILA